eukprot:gb/GFBE01056753.1/.p1 GENE.gb/GFBE01056753.1/~~gb/GFBE01056753.1/.p1  ORF type:complete len:275 (+),score=48.73 gb/GFBE01056753.1/:1-825(+)
MAGACERGAECTFAHGKQDLQPVPDLSKTGLCYRFKRGQCKEGEACKYAHGVDELRGSSQDQETRRGARKSRRQKKAAPEGAASATPGLGGGRPCDPTTEAPAVVGGGRPSDPAKVNAAKMGVVGAATPAFDALAWMITVPPQIFAQFDRPARGAERTDLESELFAVVKGLNSVAQDLRRHLTAVQQQLDETRPHRPSRPCSSDDIRPDIAEHRHNMCSPGRGAHVARAPDFGAQFSQELRDLGFVRNTFIQISESAGDSCSKRSKSLPSRTNK